MAYIPLVPEVLAPVVAPIVEAVVTPIVEVVVVDLSLVKASNLSDIPNAGTARTSLGLGTLATQSGTFSGTSSGTNTGDQTLSDATISTTDITTNNASASKHGFCPKLSTVATEFLNGTGAFSTPAGGGGGPWTRVVLSADRINNNATLNTLADVTGLSFAVTSGLRYWFKFWICYTAQATTTGSRWTLNGPAFTGLAYMSEYSLTGTTTTRNANVIAYNSPAASNATSASTGANNIAVIEGFIQPSANGTLIARFASEVANSAITAKVGSFVEHTTA